MACAKLGVVLVRPLTPGGQKAVYLVQTPDGVLSVLKVVNLTASSDPAAIERARREVELLTRIDHPNVVKVTSELIEIGARPDAMCWLESYLEGTDLRNCGSGWSAADLVALARDVAAGLGALHSHGVIHRDLSPGNVQRLNRGGFVVMDPGVAKHTLRTGITVGGQPGTPGYMTPEHIQSYSGAPTPASDVFGCGALVYLAATGAAPVPYKGDDNDYLRRLRTADHVALAVARPDLPSKLIGVVERTLHRQPARRYRNGSALYVALEGVA